MTEFFEKRLVLLAQLRASLVLMEQTRSISGSQAHGAKVALDGHILEAVAQLPPRLVSELLDQCLAEGLNLGPELTSLQLKLKLGQVQNRRLLAQQAHQTSIDLSRDIPGLTAVPLNPFSWDLPLTRWTTVVAASKNPDTSFAQLREAVLAFFQVGTTPCIPPLFPVLGPNPINRFLNQGLAQSDQVPALDRDLSWMRQILAKAESETLHAGAQGRLAPTDLLSRGAIAYRLLKDRLFAPGRDDLSQFAVYALQWSGPEAASFQDQWFQRNNDQEYAGLCLAACTGINPFEGISTWEEYVQKSNHREQAGLRRFLDALKEEPALYELCLVIAFLPAELAEADWWPLLCQWRLLRSAPVMVQERVAVAVQSESFESEEAAEEEEGTDSSELEPDEFEPEDEIEQLSAPASVADPADDPIDQISTWNQYFKPFLKKRDNLLAMLAGTFLVIAMVFLSLGFWEHGALGRVLAGMIMTLIATVGTAWVCRYMGQLQPDGEPDTPENLFGSLAFLSVPFNILLGASLLKDTQEQWSLVVGAINLAILPWIARWIEKPLGHRAILYMLAGNGGLYLPYILQKLGFQPDLAIESVLFLNLGILWMGLGLAHGRAPQRFRYTTQLFLGHYLLSMGAMLVYFQHVPSATALGLWSCCAALCVAGLGQQREAMATVIAGSLSVLGLGLLASDPRFLTLGLVLASLLWYQRSRVLDKPWVREVFAGFILAQGLCAGYNLPAPQISVLLLGLLHLGMLKLWEIRFLNREIRTLSFALPLLLAGCVATNLYFGANLWITLIGFLTGVLAYVRQVRWFNLRLWLVSLGLTWLLGLSYALGAIESIKEVPLLVAAILTAVWAVISLVLRDTLARNHRTTVLWAMSFVTAVLCGATLILNQTPDAAILTSLGLVVVCLFESGRRARSSLPIYVAMILTGLATLWLCHAWSIHLRTGLLSACLAALMLLLSHWVVKHQVWSGLDDAETFFARPFLLQSNLCLQGPAFVATLGLVLAGLVTGLRHLEPANQTPLLAVAMALHFAVLVLLAGKSGSRWLGFLIPLPLLGLLASLVLALPESWKAPALVGCFWCWAAVRKGFRALPASFQDPVTRPFEKLFGFLALLFVPLSWAILVLNTLQFSYPALILSGLAILAFSHNYLVLEKKETWAYLFWFQALVWGLALASPYWMRFGMDHWLLICFGLAVPLGLLGWACGFIRTEIGSAYERAATPWQALVLLCLLVLTHLSRETLPMWLPISAYLLLHLCVRDYKVTLAFFFKAAFLWPLFGFLPLLDQYVACLMSFCFLETLLQVLGTRVTSLRLQTEDPTDYQGRLGTALVVMLTCALPLHFGLHLLALQNAIPLHHVLLYALIPCLFWVESRSEGHEFGYAALGLFAYTNGFLATLAGPWLAEHGLSIMQGVNISFMASLLVLQVVNALLKGRVSDQKTLQIEHICVALTVMVISMALAGFLIAHQLEQRFEQRFLVGGSLLGMASIYLRFRLAKIGLFQQALYRLATTMTLWAIALWFFPSPKLILWMIAIPAFYFLFRLEAKAKAEHADSIAAGLLLALVAFLDVQQQALRMVLFPSEPFDWSMYYQNAPMLICVGVGMIRLHKYAVWRASCVIGSVLTLVGLTLSLSMLAAAQGLVLAEGWVTILLMHLTLLGLFVSRQGIALLSQFSGMPEEEWPTFHKQIFGFANLGLSVALVYLVLKAEGRLWVYPLLFACIGGFLYGFHRRTVALVLILAMAFSSPLAAIAFPTLPPLVFLFLPAALLGTCVLIRRKPLWAELLSNEVFLVLALGYVSQAWYFSGWNLENLARFMLFFICWALIPNRPFAVARKNHAGFWPLLMAVSVACVLGGFGPLFFPVLALLCIVPPTLLALLIHTESFAHFARARRWRVIPDWVEASRQALFFLSLMAIGSAVVGFGLNQNLYAHGWLPVLLTLGSFAFGMAVAIYYAVRTHGIRHAVLAEALLWLSLALLRWKLQAIEALGSPGAMDGYALLLCGCVVAGVREVLRNRGSQLSGYFYFTSQIYSLIGWLYLVYLRLSDGMPSVVELGSLILAGQYGLLARAKKNNLVYAFVFANIGLALFFSGQAWHNPQVFAVPILASALVLAQLFQKELGSRRVHYVRLYCSLAMMGISALYNVVDFQASVWYPMTAALIAALIVVAGIALRVRIFLFLGSAFIAVNLLATLIHVVIARPPEQLKLLLGGISLLVGLIFLGSFMLFQAKRQEILNQYKRLTEELTHWD